MKNRGRMVKTKQYVVARVKPVLSTLDDTGSKFTIRIILKGLEKKIGAAVIYLEKGLLFLLLPRMVVPAGPSLALSRNQLAGGSFRSVFSCRRAKAACGGAEEYFTTALLFTSLPPRNNTDPWFPERN